MIDKYKYEKVIFICIIMFILTIVISGCSKSMEVVYDQKIDTEKLNLILNNYSETKHIFLFSRDTCDNCIELAPNINNVFQELSQSEYYFNYYDTNDNRKDDNFSETLDDLGIRTIPTIIIYDYKSSVIRKIDDYAILGDYNLLLEEITSASKKGD